MTEKKTQFLSQLPTSGFIFWPVGTGDSTTIVIDDESVIQIDLHHLTDSGENDSCHAPIVNELEELLPRVDDEPYLAAFVLTHPDQDHCLGFADLLERVKIGELWFTPRVFREYKKDLCDDATAFREEVERRIKQTIANGAETRSGDRILLIGYDELLEEDDFRGFPTDGLVIPGNFIEDVDGRNTSDLFRAFVHAPFKDDSTGERNDTSVAMHLTLIRDGQSGTLLTFGDLCYPTIRKIFDRSEDDDLRWNVMLAAHHCSKSVMYWQGEDEEQEALKQDLLDDMEAAAGSPGYVVASSEPVPSSNEPGDNPPHSVAKYRYEEIAPDGFLCTQEYPTSDDQKPIIFEIDDDGFRLIESNGNGDDEGGEEPLAAAVASVRGGDEPPKERVGFGESR